MSEDHYANPYMQVFLSDIFLRPSCYDCKCKNGKSGSDLTLGDFWCAEKVDSYIDDDNGLSLVLINNPKKMQIGKSLCFQREFLFKDVKNLNGGFQEKHHCNKVRRYLFYRFYSHLNMSRSLRYSLLLYKVVSKIKKICM